MKDIRGYEGLYAVTEDGRVWSYRSNKYLSASTSGGNSKTGDYLVVCLCKDGKPNMKLVHRLVAGAYIPNPSKKRQVNHMDTDKTNNHFSNLEWVTPYENLLHAYESGLRKTKPGLDAEQEAIETMKLTNKYSTNEVTCYKLSEEELNKYRKG